MNASRRTRRCAPSRSRIDRERGAALVEAALILPLALLVVMGILEFGLLFKDELMASSAVGSAAREASAYPKTDFRQRVIDVVNSKFDSHTGDLLAIFKADGVDGSGKPTGLPQGITATNVPLSCTTCDVYRYDGSQWAHESGSGWPANQQYACRDAVLPRTGPDRVGVLVKSRHGFVTGNFIGALIGNGADSNGRDVIAHNAFTLEPVVSNCDVTP